MRTFMKTNTNLKKGGWKGKLLILLMALFMVTCVEFEKGIDGPETAQAGETITFTVHPYIHSDENRENVRMIIGFLAPTSWDAAKNTTVTYTSDAEQGVQKMSLVSRGILVEWSDADYGNGSKLNWWDLLDVMYGVGPNVLQDMEWVVYQTDKTYNISADEEIHANVNITTKVGQQNLRTKLGFFVGETADGVWMDSHYDVQYTDCFEVTGGQGAIVDFCELHLNAATPTSAIQDDIITLIYQGNIKENDLQDADDIYLCAIARTESGNSYEVCGGAEKSRMIKRQGLNQTFELSIWPRDYFGIPAEEVITEIEYIFTNADRSIEVMSDLYEDQDSPWRPFSYTMLCNN